MTLTALHRRKASRLTAEENGQANRHFLATEYAAEHEDELLRKVFAGHSFPEEVFDGDRACRVVACFLQDGASFHEALLECCFYLDFPGHYFHWRRGDLASYRPTFIEPKKRKRRKEPADHVQRTPSPAQASK